MPTLGIQSTGTGKPFSVRRNVNRKILRFSLCLGLLGSGLTVFAYLAPAYRTLERSHEINRRALSEIECTETTCDSSLFATDTKGLEPDYVIDEKTRFFLDFSSPAEENLPRFAPLDFSDTAFITQFRQPNSYMTPDGEVWRLFSRSATSKGRTVEIMIGYALKTPTKMLDTPPAMNPVVDVKLRGEADRLVESLDSKEGESRRPARHLLKLSADGFQIVYVDTQEILDQGNWLPTFLPKGKSLPAPGRRLYLRDSELYLIQADANGRLLAISLVPVESLWWLATLAAVAFAVTSIIARGLSRRFLRNYFALTAVRVPNVEEACRQGEGQSIEFKRALSENETHVGSVEDELLKSIAAFSNTDGGVIFVGIDNAGKIRGLELDYNKRDRFEQKIRQLVRNRIRPAPPIQFTFEEFRGLIVVKIVVARGESLVHLLNGVIYIRSGSSDVQAQPEDFTRLVAEFAF